MMNGYTPHSGLEIANRAGISTRIVIHRIGGLEK